jgi:hypothetical protein
MLKRDTQGKFALKDDAARQVRSVRLTDQAWKILGINAECLGMTRSDYLSYVISESLYPSITRLNSVTFPENIGNEGDVKKYNKSEVEQATTLPTIATLEAKRNQVLLELKLGKQAPGYKVAFKALNNFIALLLRQDT